MNFVFVILTIAVLVTGIILMRRWKARQDGKNSRDYTNEIIARLECQYEVIVDAPDISTVMSRYKALLAEGKIRGFTPVLLYPSHEIYNMLVSSSTMSDYVNAREWIIEASHTINAKDFLSQRFLSRGFNVGSSASFGAAKNKGPNTEFTRLMDFRGVRIKKARPYQKILVVKIPTINSWEVAAWLPCIGYNQVLFQEQVAALRYWHEKYGAIPAALLNDGWELYVERPIRSLADEEELSNEFCSIVCGFSDSLHNSMVHMAAQTHNPSFIDATVWSLVI